MKILFYCSIILLFTGLLFNSWNLKFIILKKKKRKIKNLKYLKRRLLFKKKKFNFNSFKYYSLLNDLIKDIWPIYTSKTSDDEIYTYNSKTNKFENEPIIDLNSTIERPRTGKKCKCGSNDHFRTNNRNCVLNKNNTNDLKRRTDNEELYNDQNKRFVNFIY